LAPLLIISGGPRARFQGNGPQIGLLLADLHLVLRSLASWQKGGIENVNGRLRRWPRDIDLAALSDQEIQEVAVTANLMPRKCLLYKTPVQAIHTEIGKDL